MQAPVDLSDAGTLEAKPMGSPTGGGPPPFPLDPPDRKRLLASAKALTIHELRTLRPFIKEGLAALEQAIDADTHCDYAHAILLYDRAKERVEKAIKYETESPKVKRILVAKLQDVVDRLDVVRAYRADPWTIGAKRHEMLKDQERRLSGACEDEKDDAHVTASDSFYAHSPRSVQRSATLASIPSGHFASSAKDRPRRNSGDGVRKGEAALASAVALLERAIAADTNKDDSALSLYNTALAALLASMRLIHSPSLRASTKTTIERYMVRAEELKARTR